MVSFNDNFDKLEASLEGKVVAYLDANAKLARKAAYAFMVIQVVLGLLLLVASVSSVLAAIACLLTAAVLLWLLVKTRPLSATSAD